MRLLLQIVLLVFALPCFGGKRVLIFCASGGHEVAAKAIKAQILHDDPTAEVILKYFPELLPDSRRALLAQLYPWAMQNFSPAIELNHNLLMEYGRRDPSYGAVSKLYVGDETKSLMRTYVEEVDPDVILSTAFVATGLLARIREDGGLAKYPVGWLHTDLASETAYAKLSAAIDMTFLGHSSLAQNWVERGIPAQRVEATGIAIRDIARRQFSTEDLDAFRKEYNIDPQKKLVVIMGGSMGGVDYQKIIDSLIQGSIEPMQIVAVTGKNTVQKEKLEKVKAGATLPVSGALPARIDLTVTGLLEQNVLMRYLETSHLIVTKTGGLTTFELAFRSKPTIYLDIVGGQESYNADFLREKKIGLVTKDPGEVGRLADQVFSIPELRASMVEAQVEFRNEIQTSKISRWVRETVRPSVPLVAKVTVSDRGDKALPSRVRTMINRALSNIVFLARNDPRNLRHSEPQAGAAVLCENVLLESK